MKLYQLIFKGSMSFCNGGGRLKVWRHHRNFIRKHYPKVYQTKKIVCLYIPDEYDYMQPELITLLKSKIEEVYQRKLI